MTLRFSDRQVGNIEQMGNLVSFVDIIESQWVLLDVQTAASLASTCRTTARVSCAPHVLASIVSNVEIVGCQLRDLLVQTAAASPSGWIMGKMPFMVAPERVVGDFDKYRDSTRHLLKWRLVTARFPTGCLIDDNTTRLSTTLKQIEQESLLPDRRIFTVMTVDCFGMNARSHYPIVAQALRSIFGILYQRTPVMTQPFGCEGERRWAHFEASRRQKLEQFERVNRIINTLLSPVELMLHEQFVNLHAQGLESYESALFQCNHAYMFVWSADVHPESVLLVVANKWAGACVVVERLPLAPLDQVLSMTSFQQMSVVD